MKDEQWNFGAALVDAAGWGLGMGLISHTTFLPLFVSKLTESPYAIGAISAILTVGWYIPGVFVARWVERLPRVKASIMAIALVERVALFAMAALTLGLGRSRPGLLLGSFFALWFTLNVCIGANTPGYYKLIAKTIPVLRRGRLYGYGGALAGLLGVGGGWAAGLLLKDYGYPTGYAWCFLAAFVCQTVSVLPIAWMREPEQAPEEVPARQSARALLSLAGVPALRGLIVAHALFCGSVMAAAFYADFALREFGATDQTIARFTVVSMATQTVAYPAIGWLADRCGNRRALQVASLAGAVAAAAPAVSGSLAGIGWGFALFQLATIGWGICWINYVLEVTPANRTASAVAVVGLFVGPVKTGLPLLGARLAQGIGYPFMFASAALLTLLSLLALALWVPEPRTEIRDALPEGDQPYPRPRREDPVAEV